MGEDFSAATPRVAAGVLVRDSEGRVLLVKPTYKKGWDLPGGYVEPGESPKAAAVRELREELGMDTAIGRLIVVDWAPHPAEGDKLLFIFEADHIDLAQVRRDGEEIGETRYVASDDLADHLPDRLLRRISGALAGGDDPYREHGMAPDHDR